MNKYEYKLVPMPEIKASARRQVKDGIFGVPVVDMMNELGANGWDYARTEVLTTTHRSILGRKRVSQDPVMVFRRPTGTIESKEAKARIALTEPLKSVAVAPRRVKAGRDASVESKRPVVMQGTFNTSREEVKYQA